MTANEPAALVPDRNVEAVRSMLADRCARGIAKYGATTERGDMSHVEWLRHLQEELLDAAVYVQAAIANGTSPHTCWRTMESAPRDGRTILVACPCVSQGNAGRYFVTEAQWKLFDEFTTDEKMAWVIAEKDDYYRVLPSAWMPMPEFFGFPPQPNGETE